MNRTFTFAVAGALVMRSVVTVALPAFAVEPGTDRSQVGQLDEKTTGASIRASQFIGMSVCNQEGKNIGKVNDLVLDDNSGRVRYAAVSYGGFLGLGDKLFAVPWQAFTCQREEGKDDHYLVINATEEKIKAAPGFDQDRWPDFADRQFTQSLDQHYGVPRSRVDVEVGRGGVDVDVERSTPRR
jgi:sporulation protein YlmC with PRC-barrel domain